MQSRFKSLVCDLESLDVVNVYLERILNTIVYVVRVSVHEVRALAC